MPWTASTSQAPPARRRRCPGPAGPSDSMHPGGEGVRRQTWAYLCGAKMRLQTCASLSAAHIPNAELVEIMQIVDDLDTSLNHS